MKWNQVDIIGPELVEEAAIASLVSVGCSGVQVVRQEDLPEYDQEWGSPPEPTRRSLRTGDEGEVLVRGYLPEDQNPEAELRESLRVACADLELSAPPEVSVTTIEDTGWSRSWRQYFKPLRIGERLLILPSWSKRQPRKNEIAIRLDPGMAFGTGQHGTTRLCLIALEKYVQPEMKVVDVGCGSGILSIAAAQLGADTVTALDTDSIAAATTRHNVQCNHVQARVTTQHGPLPIPGPPADLVAANILAQVVIDLIPAISGCLSQSNGARLLVASGIVRSQELHVKEALQAHHFEIVEVSHSGEWSCIVGTLKTEKPPAAGVEESVIKAASDRDR